MTQDCIPSMIGSKYALDVSQLVDCGALHTDAHMLIIQMQ